MYYKITNKESDVYKKLYELRKQEIQMEKDNRKAVEQIVGQPFKGWIGQSGQQNFWRTTQYVGFDFENPENLPPKTWKLNKKYNSYFPDKRTKAGKEILKKLAALPNSSVCKVFRILDIMVEGSFGFPYVEICSNNDVILWVSDRFDKFLRKNTNIIEITYREFMGLLD